MIVKSKFLRKSTSKSTRNNKQNDDDSLSNLNHDMNNLVVDCEKNINYYKMPTGNSNFTFNFEIDENQEK